MFREHDNLLNLGKHVRVDFVINEDEKSRFHSGKNLIEFLGTNQCRGVAIHSFRLPRSVAMSCQR